MSDKKKAVKKIDDIVSLSAQIKNELSTNFFKIFKLQLVIIILIIISMFFLNFLKIRALEHETKVLSELLTKYARYVIIATPDGRVFLEEKKPLNEELIKPYIALILKNYFVFDRKTLSNDFKNTYSSFKDFVKYLKDKHILDELKNFFASSKELANFLKMYYLALPNLAEVIKVDDISLKIEKNKKDVYHITGEIHATLNEYIDGEWQEVEATGKVDLLALISPQYATPLNPYGFRVIKINKFTLFTKGD